MKNNYCESCGNLITEEMKFCNSCGHELEKTQTDEGENNPLPQATIIQPQAPIIQPQAPIIPPQPQVYQSQPQFNQPQQSAPTYQSNPYSVADPKMKPLSTGDFILAFILMAIPIVGFIVILVWALSSETNKNRKSFARAIIIMWIISFIISLVTIILFWSAFMTIIGQINY